MLPLTLALTLTLLTLRTLLFVLLTLLLMLLILAIRTYCRDCAQGLRSRTALSEMKCCSGEAYHIELRRGNEFAVEVVGTSSCCNGAVEGDSGACIDEDCRACAQHEVFRLEICKAETNAVRREQPACCTEQVRPHRSKRQPRPVSGAAKQRWQRQPVVGQHECNTIPWQLQLRNRLADERAGEWSMYAGVRLQLAAGIRSQLPRAVEVKNLSHTNTYKHKHTEE